MAGPESRRTAPPVSRRDEILRAATRLFADRGFSETGIDDVGEAVGITGPAVYRHFGSKHDVLVAVIEESVVGLHDTTARALEGDAPPEQALRHLVHCTVEACIESRALTAIYWQERRNLPPAARRRVDRLHRELTDEWVAVLRPLRSDLSDSDARMVVHAVSALIQSVANRATTLDRRRVHELLEGMALAALLESVPAEHLDDMVLA